MSAKKLDEFPSEVKEQLPEGARNIFLAAFNSASGDGLDEEAAMRVAWNTVRHDYEQGADGSWQRKSEENNIHGKAVTSGGN
jgi:cation transport regulator